MPRGGSCWHTRPTSAVSSRRCQNTWRTYLSGDCGLGERRRYHHGSLCSGVGWVSGSFSCIQPSYSSAKPNHMWPIHHILFPSSDLVATLDVQYTSGVHSVTNLAFYGVLPIPGYGCYWLMIQCKMLEILTEACSRRIRFNARSINPVIRVNVYMWSEMNGNHQIWGGREQCRLHQFVDAMHNSFPLFCNSQKSTIMAYNKVALSGKWSIKIIPAARHKP